VYPSGQFEGAPAFKLARAGGANKKFTELQMAELRPYQRAIQGQAKNLSPEVQDVIMKAVRKSFVRTCVLEWKNINDKNDQPVPFSHEAAEKLFTQLPELYNELLSAAQSLATYQDEVIEADAGN
jgi:hypothetical protein